MNQHLRYICLSILFFLIGITGVLAAGSLSVKGRITEQDNKTPVSYANVYLPAIGTGTQSDENGYYELTGLQPGFYQVKVSCLGYQSYLSYQFRLSTTDYTLDVSLEKDAIQLKEINVSAPTFRKNPEAPLSLQVISLKEIEKIPGANRDISKVISSFAGVATSSEIHRNDILVRGGGPSENKFYLDGIEIPNINHFATQGASGGPVGIINADLLREVDFYSGAFPVARENGVSSVLDFKLKDGSEEKRTYKFTLGASEAGISSNGPLGDKTTYQVSVRYSYLQFLFSVLNLPFLPQYIDGQFKVKTRFNSANELTILGIGAIDDSKLNDDVDPNDEDRFQIYQTLPEYKQKTYTVGAVYKHYAGNHTQLITLSNSLLRNGASKYKDNDRENPDKLRLKYHSDEAQTRIRFENTSRLNQFRLVMGVSAEYATYTNRTLNNTYRNDAIEQINYHTFLDIWKYAAFTSVSFRSENKKLDLSAGLRIDGNSYSNAMSNPFKQFAPRASLSYNLAGPFYLNANAGRYFQLPLYTAMGYKDAKGTLVNKATLRYFRSDQVAGGLEFRPSDALKVNGDFFYKWFAHGASSLQDSIPVSSQGNDFGVIGNEAVISDSKGKAYGFELSAKWILMQKISLLTSYTFVRSLVFDKRKSEYVSATWDNRNLFTGTLLYSPARSWDVGIKFRYMGGMPYTPVDTEKSALVESWNTLNESVKDYSEFNSLRLKAFTQFDIRVEKTFFWKKFMLDLYLDIQNLLNHKSDSPAKYISTGVIENPDAPLKEQRYRMKWLQNEGGTILPTVGVIFEF
ncbi:MAG: TonB-dependent receptor [Bacteroidales bacterium]